ncbi:malonyl-ACP O-methyltransferase BioC [Moellerella wisconsensis]
MVSRTMVLITMALSEQKHKIAQAFGRAAAHYDNVAEFQQQTGYLLYQLLVQLIRQFPTTDPMNSSLFSAIASKASKLLLQNTVSTRSLCGKKILDAGCGTGYFSDVFQQQGAEVTALDLSSGMLEVARKKGSAQHFICADMEAIPIADKSFDVTFSNLAIQWCDPLDIALSELYRVTKPGGWVIFTTLAEGSLVELSQAWQQVDNKTHVNHFLALSSIKSTCSSWRNNLLLQPITPTYTTLNGLLRSLKGIGATHLTQGRQSGLMTRQQLNQLEQVYPTVNDRYPLTYQTVFGVLYRD